MPVVIMPSTLWTADAEGIERIVIAEFWFHDADAHEADHACDKTYGHGRKTR